MKASRIFFMNVAAAGFLCLPVLSAYAAAPQEQHPDGAQEHHGTENHQQAKPGHESHNSANNHNSTNSHNSANHVTQEQHPNAAQEHHDGTENRQQANPGRESHNSANNHNSANHVTQQHRTVQPADGSTYSQQHRMNGNQTAAHNRGNQRLPAYNFGSRQQQQLRQGFDRGGYRHQVNTRNRPHLARGGYLPRGWQGRMHPVPRQYITILPAPPPGYLIGYFDGYAVVYDPNTGLILQFLNVY